MQITAEAVGSGSCFPEQSPYLAGQEWKLRTMNFSGVRKLITGLGRRMG
jgi:hypothetical protein